MKKTVLFICLVLLCSGVFGQDWRTEYLSKWQNTERVMRRIAGTFIQDRKKDPEQTVQHIRDASSGLYLKLDYMSKTNSYTIIVILQPPHDITTFKFPLTEAVSIKTGFTRQMELLYGQPKSFFYEDDLVLMWDCLEWYTRAYMQQRPNGQETITLAFSENSYY